MEKKIKIKDFEFSRQKSVKCVEIISAIFRRKFKVNVFEFSRLNDQKLSWENKTFLVITDFSTSV